MINSFDINAIVDSKIKELKTAQPKIKLLTSTLKDIVEAIDNAILDIKNKIVDDKSMKAVHNNIAKLMGKSGIGGIIEQLSTMSYSKIVSRFNEEVMTLFDSLHKFIDNAASISPEKISKNMSGVNMLLGTIVSTISFFLHLLYLLLDHIKVLFKNVLVFLTSIYSIFIYLFILSSSVS